MRIVKRDFKRLSRVLITVSVMLFFVVGLAYAETTTVIAQKNEFGGKTTKTVYTQGDKNAELFVDHFIYYYDTGRKAKEEYSYTEKIMQQTGFKKAAAYFNVATEKVAKQEYEFTDAISSANGYLKYTDHYGSKGIIVRREAVYTDKYSKENAMIKHVDYYDSNRITHREYYYTDKHAETKGYYRFTVTYSASNMVATRAFDYTQKYAKENGFDKLINYFDATGKQVKQEYYKDNKLVK
ncbi:MAG: hypothetical protein EPN22_02780 [Nitrospirae bacterium]|nr:MAG: hypothetical protein EPN22_02780 [Nitrospirota bacterium]